jgi:hypothetical protein
MYCQRVSKSGAGWAAGIAYAKAPLAFGIINITGCGWNAGLRGAYIANPSYEGLVLLPKRLYGLPPINKREHRLRLPKGRPKKIRRQNRILHQLLSHAG